ncbi:MAG TPA: hypothetical protein ENI23_13430 [bacterium]|nr:hypothetical protein [bacterium]
MAVIIGNASTVTTTLFAQGGIVSVNFGIQPNINRLWELGSFTPYDIFTQRQRTLSIVAYGKKLSGQGGSQSIDVTPSTSCIDTGAISITVTPGVCADPVGPFTDDFYPTGYSYSKEVQGFGQESWTFTSKPLFSDYTGEIRHLRGIATGQILKGAGTMTEVDTGIVVDDAASKDSQGAYIEGETGSVAAGFPGLGTFETQREVIVTRVGASLGKADGLRAQTQITIPMTPVFL